MRRAVWVAFAAVCVLSASSWIVPRSEDLPALELQAIRYGLIGLVALFVGSVRLPLRGTAVRVAVAGVGFFGIPTMVVEWARAGVAETSRIALFAMVPVVVVMVVA